MEYAEVKGRKEWIAEGIEKGRAESEKKKQIEVARNLKRMGLSVETIVQGTGLTAEEIESLKSQLLADYTKTPFHPLIPSLHPSIFPLQLFPITTNMDSPYFCSVKQ